MAVLQQLKLRVYPNISVLILNKPPSQDQRQNDLPLDLLLQKAITADQVHIYEKRSIDIEDKKLLQIRDETVNDGSFKFLPLLTIIPGPINWQRDRMKKSCSHMDLIFESFFANCHFFVRVDQNRNRIKNLGAGGEKHFHIHSSNKSILSFFLSHYLSFSCTQLSIVSRPSKDH